MQLLFIYLFIIYLMFTSYKKHAAVYYIYYAAHV